MIKRFDIVRHEMIQHGLRLFLSGVWGSADSQIFQTAEARVRHRGIDKDSRLRWLPVWRYSNVGRHYLLFIFRTWFIRFWYSRCLNADLL